MYPKKIYKYKLGLEDVQEIEMPGGTKILCVQTQRNKPYLWAEVTPDKITRTYKIITVGTGQILPESDYIMNYVGTYQLNSGFLVFHVYWAG